MNPILLPLAQAASSTSGDGTWFNNPAIQLKLGTSFVETLAMVSVSGVLTIVFGLLLGLTLVATGQRGQWRNPPLYWILSQIVNLGRSMPFIVLMVALINDVDHGKVEAALMMGASGRQITWGVLVREALPILIQSATVTIITLLGYSAMAGAIGGGGLGDLAIQDGYQRNMADVMVITVVVIVVIVGVIQLIGDMLSRLVNHR